MNCSICIHVILIPSVIDVITGGLRLESKCFVSISEASISGTRDKVKTIDATEIIVKSWNCLFLIKDMVEFNFNDLNINLKGYEGIKIQKKILWEKL